MKTDKVLQAIKALLANNTRENAEKLAEAAGLTLKDMTFSIDEQKSIVSQWMNKVEIEHLKKDLVVSDEIIILAQKYQLTLYEQMALRYYTDSGYAALNAVLNGSDSLSDESKIIELKGAQLLCQALDKLPDHSGVVVYSRQNFPQAFLDKLLNWEDVLFPAFLSANVGYDIRAFRKHRLIIESKTGKHLAWISAHKDTEDEVLFKNKIWFSVDDIEYRPNNEIWFYLSEAGYD